MADSTNALVEAVRRKDYAAIRRLLESGLDVNLKDANGRTALTHAVLDPGPSTDMLQFLIDQGADVNSGDRDGRTALMDAMLAAHPSVDILRVLINSGANVNAQDKNQGWTALHFAARDQRLELVQLLIAAGAKVDAEDSYGNTPLVRAAFSKSYNAAVIRALLDAGADPEHKNKNGRSANDLAVMMGATELHALLQRR